MLKQIALAGFASFTVAAFPVVSKALTVQEVPNPRQVNGGWVTDMADMLSPATEAQLNQIISDLEAKNSSEIAVVTVPETSPSATPKRSLRRYLITGALERKGERGAAADFPAGTSRRNRNRLQYRVDSPRCAC